MKFEELKGKILTKIEVVEGKIFTTESIYEFGSISTGESLVIIDNNNCEYVLGHLPDCCESVTIDDIIGDMNDLLNSEILLAEEVENGPNDIEYGTETWTFYKLSTIKGDVTIRFYGTSNGCYSESVSFFKVCKEDE
jgi:hypothetical protein